ncbi:MAG: hypothetical protein M0P47_06025 [Bacteroidales bacterium]|nr:hypothetical protein [Bacteroidales bacterium]
MRLFEVTDANSRTVKYRYAYQGNDFIRTVAIDNLSATQNVIKIDKFGNRINIIDPSSGSIEETYNTFGELISRKDQKQTELNKTQYTYDMLGRMITRNEDGKLTTWTVASRYITSSTYVTTVYTAIE